MELGITQKELAEITKLSLPTIERWSYSNNIPENNKNYLNLIIHNHNLEAELNEIKVFFEIFDKYSKSSKGVTK